MTQSHARAAIRFTPIRASNTAESCGRRSARSAIRVKASRPSSRTRFTARCVSIEDSAEQYFPDTVAVLNAFFQDAPVFLHLDVAFAAEHHQISVVAEVAVPFDALLLTPGRVSTPHLFIVHAVEIGAQIDAGFIQRLIRRFLFEVPNRLSHIENQSESCSAKRSS